MVNFSNIDNSVIYDREFVNELNRISKTLMKKLNEVPTFCTQIIKCEDGSDFRYPPIRYNLQTKGNKLEITISRGLKRI